MLGNLLSEHFLFVKILLKFRLKKGFLIFEFVLNFILTKNIKII
jgi:hypothetical protein